MNAHPSDLSPPTSDCKSLMDQCRNRRSELLQQFARLEIALKRRLKTPHKSFGSKMKAWIKDEPENTKGFDRLINARILVAHAYVRPLHHEGTPYLLWELAEGKCELNCAKFDKPALKAWADELDARRRRFCVKLWAESRGLCEAH